MAFTVERVVFAFALCLYMCPCESAKINTPRVLLPWFDNLNVNFTFEIIEGGCYTWSLSRDDIIDLEPLYEDGCSRAARVTVSKRCVAPGTVIILAEEIHTGELLRGDVDVDKIHSLKVMSTTMKLYLEEAPEAFEVIAYDDKGNRFSSLDGVSFTWTIENVGSTAGEDNIVTLVRWRDTDYEAPRGITELEAVGLRAYIVLLYGQAMGDARGTVCLDDICTDFHLQVVASVVLTPATAYIAPGDTIRYKVVRMRAGRLTVQDVGDTLYNMIVPDTGLAYLEDKISLVRGTEVGSTTVTLMSGSTEVTTATLTIAEPHSIRVSLRPSKLLIRGEDFVIHCVVLDRDGHTLFAGQETLIRLSVNGEANVELLRSTENGTITDAVALDAGQFIVTAKLHSIAGKLLHKKVEGTVTGVAVDPLQIVPPELFVAWTDTIQEVPLKHIGGGNESVIWSVSEKATTNAISLTPAGVVSVRGEGELEVKVQLKNYPHVRAFGKVWSIPPELVQVSSSGHARVGRPHQLHIALTATHPVTGEYYNYHRAWSIPPELVQVSSSGHARVGRPHQLHIALTATHPVTGEYYNYHRCNCGSFAVSLLEGPEPHNVTSAQWVEPADGACCVLECVYTTRGVSTIRVSRGRAGDTTRVAVRAAPALLWPHAAAALVGATLPVLAEGEALVPQSSEPRIVELSSRDGPTPHRYPDIQLFTLKCRRKGDSRLELVSLADDERESADFEAACAPFVSRVRLEPSDTPGNCTGGPRVWLRPGHEVTVRVVLLDAIGRELLDERGPKATWDLEPHHPGIEYKSTDRLLVETHPDYAPVPVPYKYYQSVVADEQAVGWTGALKISIPEATASIQARVVGPLKCDPLKVNTLWFLLKDPLLY
ncbi:nuclear pore membrane glycoprotein 210 [Ostrinia nubilalis]|uniref:nuclear pore membrane glycoprotein 210 n=1 Tax=Ostrinia nubilalis TaxID=29057 RepID=UPI003082498D